MGKDQTDDSKEKALNAFCEEVRLRGKVTCRTAIVDDDRKEFFRGKDLMRYCEANAEKLDGITSTGQQLDAQMKDLMAQLLRQQAIVACDRFYKRPHPGRKHLVKFPRKLEPRPRPRQGWDPEAFYVWIEDRPMPPWQIALAVLLAVTVLALCLFPLAPAWARSGAVYLFLGLLGGIFALIALRFFLFLIVFTFIGYEFWLFPNLLSDQVDLIGAFIPLQSFGKPEDGKSHLGTRIGGFLGVSFMIYAFYVYSPDESTLSLKKTNESILDMFNNVQKPGLGPGTGYGPPQFGNDRNVDVEKIRQARLLEIQRRKEEAQKRRAQGLASDAEPEEAPAIPSLDEVLSSDEEEANAGAAAAAAAAQEDVAGAGAADAQAHAPVPPAQAEGGSADAAAEAERVTQGASEAAESAGAATHTTAGAEGAASRDAEANARVEL